MTRLTRALWDAIVCQVDVAVRRARPPARPRRRHFKINSRSLGLGKLTPTEQRAARRLVRLPVIQRPRTRGDCAKVPRPCPYVGCRNHLYTDITAGGALKLNFPDRDVTELAETCSLDVAERGGVFLEDVGRYLNVTMERARQIEMEAADHVRQEIERRERVGRTAALLAKDET